ncbi:MAG: hypothetical protein ACYC8T_07500 [Myxococcaceae bacterium]
MVQLLGEPDQVREGKCKGITGRCRTLSYGGGKKWLDVYFFYEKAGQPVTYPEEDGGTGTIEGYETSGGWVMHHWGYR